MMPSFLATQTKSFSATQMYIDALLLASQQYEEPAQTQPIPAPVPATAPVNKLHPQPAEYAAPIMEQENYSEKTQCNSTENNKKVWEEWCQHRTASTASTTEITPSQLQYWMIRFILEVRKRNGTEYPPETLVHLCSGVVRHLKMTPLTFLKIKTAEFRTTLDAEMKRLQTKGVGSKT